MSFKGTLLPYQPEAVDKMCQRTKMLVAYDLGLGKTVITIAAIERLMDEGKVKEPGIVVCLSSLKYQWANQIKKFTNDTSKAIVIDGSKAKRQSQYQEAYNWKETKVDYVIMNYEQVVNDWDLIKKLPSGGSSLLANLIAVGYVLGVARRTPEIAEGIKANRVRKLS
jgi:SNF2 family DNA or RNA helicase